MEESPAPVAAPSVILPTTPPPRSHPNNSETLISPIPSSSINPSSASWEHTSKEAQQLSDEGFVESVKANIAVVSRGVKSFMGIGSGGKDGVHSPREEIVSIKHMSEE